MLGEAEKNLSPCPTFVDLQQFLSRLFPPEKSAKLSEGLLLLCGVQVVFPVCVSEHAGAGSCAVKQVDD